MYMCVYYMYIEKYIVIIIINACAYAYTVYIYGYTHMYTIKSVYNSSYWFVMLVYKT